MLETLQRVLAAITVLAILALVVLIAAGAESRLLTGLIPGSSQPNTSSQQH